MAFPRVDDGEPARPERLEHASRRRHRAPQPRHVVAQHLAETARLEEVPLHVDHEQRGRRRLADELVRLRLDGDHAGNESCSVSSGTTRVPAVPRSPASASSSAQIVAWPPQSCTKR